MIFEITGTHFQNKGAELMTAAIADRIYREGHIPAMQPWGGSFEKRARYGLYQLMWYQRFGVPWSRFPSPFPRKLRRQYGLAKFSEVDVILDASGFKYTDQWPAEQSLESADYYHKRVSQGKKLILMPQAMGPFENPVIAGAVKRILDDALLVFIRDDHSFQFVEELYGKDPKIRKAPDCTILLKGIPPDEPFFENEHPRLCLVPNQRMLDKTGNISPEQYAAALAVIGDFYIRQGFSPFILIHELGTDMEVAERIRNQLSSPVEIMVEDHALRIKGKIGASDLLIGSRFHGLVSALSQGIPAIGTGWSHKYRLLYKDYQVEELYIALSKNPLPDLQTTLESLDLDKIRKNLSIQNQRLKAEAEKMWQTIFQAIKY